MAHTAVEDRVQIAVPTGRSAAASTRALDIWAFGLPAISFVQVTVVGQLVISEVLAVVLLPWLTDYLSAHGPAGDGA